MYVLDRLWRDGISPSERYVTPGSDYEKGSKRFYAELKQFVEMLTPEAKKQLELVDNLRHDQTMLAEEDVFICGFRMGARLMLDIVSDHRGQFYAPEEGQL